MQEIKQYDDETLKHIQNVELMILKDLIQICEENDIEYYAYCGTALGAIRHQGFIPWDDDVDIIMFREDYERFLNIMKSDKYSKYELLNLETTDDYLFMCSKMSLKGTKRDEVWARNTSFDAGIHIDIFMFDSAPSSKFKWSIYYYKCQFLKLLSDTLIVIKNDIYYTNSRKIIGKLIKSLFGLLHISDSTFLKLYKKFVDNTNQNDELVYQIESNSYKKPLPKEIFRPPKKVKFESIEINVPNDVEYYLTVMYGDYMKLPPEDERYVHFSESIDFGEY